MPLLELFSHIILYLFKIRYKKIFQRANFVLKRNRMRDQIKALVNPCGDGSSMSRALTLNTEVYCIDAARVVTNSKLVVQLQKSNKDQMKCQHEERLTNTCLMSAELAVVRTALTCYSGKKECPVLLL